MSRVLSVIALLLFASPASAVTGNAPPAAGWAARAIVMIVDTRDDLCTGTALTPDLVLTAAHCVVRNVDYQVKAYQAGGPIPVRTIARHPRFDYASYAASRATADVALIKLAAAQTNAELGLLDADVAAAIAAAPLPQAKVSASTPLS